ncbi:MAG: nucleoside deaminase [Neisseriaceae bacterium]|nr:MAG: nucleoside deaminase [Neisseriaceae bacterium]
MSEINIPYYLKSKLERLNLATTKLIRQHGYLEIYSQLKLAFPSINYQALYDLYCLAQQSLCYTLAPEKQAELRAEFKAMTPRHIWLKPDTIKHFLTAAEEQAQLALQDNEVPIGAVIVHQEQIIARGYNRTRRDNDIMAHAEIVAILAAQQHLQNYRLSECDLYITVEPCLMCSGAIINSRIKRVIFGACEPKTGAYISQHQVFNNKKTNHHTEVIGPIDQNHYSRLISTFFQNKS